MFDPSGGFIRVICGPMFSGKTERLLFYLRRAEIAKKKIALFKPAKDTRYSKDSVCTHYGSSMEAKVVPDSSAIFDLVEADTEVVGIDEAQFFDDKLTEICRKLANDGKIVILAGLDQDFRTIPFGSMPQLLVEAEKVEKIHAICELCGKSAQRTFRKTDSAEQVMLGGKNEYIPLCRNCYNKYK